MLISLLFLAAQAASPVPTRDVIVTGERLKALHEQCTRGKCSVLRDAQASIAWAESQFREGRYVEAKRTLRNAAARNKQHASTNPRPVAAIYEAYATVSWQEGDQDIFRAATAARVRTLRDHLPADDIAVRGAALALGDMWLRLGSPFDAQKAYEAADRQAVAAGLGDVALRARLARARLRHLFDDLRGADALLTSAASLPGADTVGPRTALAAMRLRFAAVDGDKAEIDRLVAGTTIATEQPVLLYAPPYPRTAADLAQAASQRMPGQMFDARGSDNALRPTGLEQRASDIDAIRWADVGFWIRPDGRTTDVEVLRGSRERGWVAPYLQQVTARRYSANVGAAADEPGVYRLERFTIRGNYGVPIGSLIRRRAGPGTLEVLDLTDPSARVVAAR